MRIGINEYDYICDRKLPWRIHPNSLARDMVIYIDCKEGFSAIFACCSESRPTFCFESRVFYWGFLGIIWSDFSRPAGIDGYREYSEAACSCANSIALFFIVDMQRE